MLNIEKHLTDDIEQYCKLNNIADVNKFCNELLQKAFTAEKYGNIPSFISIKPKPVQEEPIIQPQVEEPQKIEKKKNSDDYEIYD